MRKSKEGNKLKSHYNRKEGVTLIILILMIVIIGILVTIVLPPLVTKDGIISKTEGAKDSYESVQEKDILSVFVFEIIDENGGNKFRLYENPDHSELPEFSEKLENKVNEYNINNNLRKNIRILDPAYLYNEKNNDEKLKIKYVAGNNLNVEKVAELDIKVNLKVGRKNN